MRIRKIKTWTVKVNRNVPFLYVVVYQRLLEKYTSRKTKPIIKFAEFRKTLNGYFRVPRDFWFMVAKEFQHYRLIKIIRNCGIKLLYK